MMNAVIEDHMHVSFVGFAGTRLYPEKTFQPRPYDSLHQRRIVAHIIDKAGLFFTVAKEACNGIVRGTR